MRFYLTIAVAVGLHSGCKSDSKSDAPPSQNTEENRAPKSDPKDPTPQPKDPPPQPEGEPPRVEVGDCYGDGDATALAHRRRATDKLRASIAGLAGCYNTSLKASAERHGGVALSFTLDTTGKARGTKAEGLDDPQLLRCVAEHVATVSLGPADAELKVECRLAFGYAPVKSLARDSKRIDVTAGTGSIDWSGAGPLPTIRAANNVLAADVLRTVAEARAAGVEDLAFETQRKGRWKYALLPILPRVQPRAPTGRVELTVFVESGRIRVADTAGKRWKIPHAGAEPNFAMLSDILKARKSKPDFEHRTDVQLAPAADVRYGQVARVMSLLTAQKFTDVTLLAWPDAAVQLDAPKEK